MGYGARASNGERSRDITTRRFQQDAAVAITNQADAINQLLTKADSLQALVTHLAGDYLQLRKDVTDLAAALAITRQELARK